MLPIVYPLAGPSTITTGRGSFSGERGQGAHGANDIVARIGTPILAATPGRVVKVYRDGRLPVGVTGREPTEGERHVGNGIAIRDPDGWTHLYAHMRDVPRFAPRQEIHAGQVLGNVGLTGNTTGPHLHYQIDRGGGRVDATSRLEVLRVEGRVDEEIRMQIRAARAWSRTWRPHTYDDASRLERLAWNQALADMRTFINGQTELARIDLEAGRLEPAQARMSALGQYVHRIQTMNVRAADSHTIANAFAEARRAFLDALSSGALAVLPDLSMPGGAAFAVIAVLAAFFLLR